MTPEEARAYIKVFRTHIVPGTDYVDTSAGRQILLDSMTDDEALFVADSLQHIEREAAKRSLNRRKPQ